MSTEPTPSPLSVFPFLSVTETHAVHALGLDASDYAVLMVPAQQMGVGFTRDPATGRDVLVLQAVVAMDAAALNMRPSGLLDASGQRAVAGQEMQRTLPVGGSLRLVVRREALAEKLRADLPPSPAPWPIAQREPVAEDGE
jgi:hypothetical protein